MCMVNLAGELVFIRKKCAGFMYFYIAVFLIQVLYLHNVNEVMGVEYINMGGGRIAAQNTNKLAMQIWNQYTDKNTPPRLWAIKK